MLILIFSRPAYIKIFYPVQMGLIHLLTYLLTYYMEQSPSLETNRFSASQENPHIL